MTKHFASGHSPPGALPSWIGFLGGAFLAGVAGFLNTAVLTVDRVPVTHVSGTVSRLSGDAARADAPDAIAVLSLLASFIAGAAISGLLIGGPQLRAGRRYGVAMLTEACLLAAATILLAQVPLAGLCLAAAAAGLQNAMVSSYGGLIVRTTHVTGIATDLGHLLGRWLRSRHAEPWKFLLLTTLLGSFFAGGVGGALAADRFGIAALWAPTALVGGAGAVYILWRVRTFKHDRTPTPADS